MYQGDFRFNSIRERQFVPEEEIDDLDAGGGSPAFTPRQETQKIEETKNQVPEFKSVPVTAFVPKTDGEGIFGVGLLAPRPVVIQEFQTVEAPSKVYPVITQPQTFRFFFIEYANQNVARGIEGKIVSFAVVITLNPVTLQQCSEMLRLRSQKITPLSENEYLTGSFSHPYYINDSNTPLQIRYAEVPILKQRTPGRLDNIPLGYPDFDSTPDYIQTSVGPIPAAPYTNFATGTGATSQISISAGATVFFVDTSPMTPWQFAPTGWMWSFGPSASPTGATAQNVLVTFGVSGSFSVSLTASNAVGSNTLTRTNFVIVT